MLTGIHITNEVVPDYSQHGGTIRVAGGTSPHAAASCAAHRISEKIAPVEFVCIGANAVNQAVKTLNVLACMLKESEGRNVLFEVMRYRTRTFLDVARTKLQTKDCVVLRVIMTEVGDGQTA